jgi:hypothetical protein
MFFLVQFTVPPERDDLMIWFCKFQAKHHFWPVCWVRAQTHAWFQKYICQNAWVLQLCMQEVKTALRRKADQETECLVGWFEEQKLDEVMWLVGFLSNHRVTQPRLMSVPRKYRTTVTKFSHKLLPLCTRKVLASIFIPFLVSVVV